MDEKIVLRQLHNRSYQNLLVARDKFGEWEFTRDWGFAVLIEEVGKLAQSHNKLGIAVDPMIVKQWQTERDHRFVTCIAVLEGMYLGSKAYDS